MQQCDDVETIYQSVLKTSLEKREEKKERPGSSSVFILKIVTVLKKNFWVWRIKCSIRWIKCDVFLKSPKKNIPNHYISWTWNLNIPQITANNKFKYQAKDSSLEYFFLEIWNMNRTFWMKATFSWNTKKLKNKNVSFYKH